MTKKFTHGGVTATAKEWAATLGISYNCFMQRVDDLDDKNRIFTKGYFRKNSGPVQKHSGSRSLSYGSWRDMHRRCSPQSRKRHRCYDRGIKICARWNDFNKFLLDMGERPAGKTLDRIDNDKGYYKTNCRWATPKVQRRNSSTVVPILYKGRTYKSMISCAEQENISYGALRQYIYRRRKNGLDTIID